jgi:hypothetical protein
MNNYSEIKNILFFITVAGWVLFAIAVSQVPLWILIVMYKKRNGSFLEVSCHFHRSN